MYVQDDDMAAAAAAAALVLFVSALCLCCGYRLLPTLRCVYAQRDILIMSAVCHRIHVRVYVC
jgi:hypothetical protein